MARDSKSQEYQRAARLAQSFTGEGAVELGNVTLPPMPTVGVAFGKIIGIIYETAAGEKFIHRFRSRSRPLLVASPDGKQLYMIGGSYTFTDRGIVDRAPRSADGEPI